MRLSIDVLHLELPSALADRADAISRAFARELAGASRSLIAGASGAVRLERLAPGPIGVDPAATNDEIAATLARAVGAEITRTLKAEDR